ncbi:sulfatase [Pontibacter sp. 172403-2]|uniref:sulfatase n=1 Tax=Pontibacter rufus TaxID=2791028 RepID=UPI0018AFF260|nr:sulfatase [Pontibacter sp. 172403-2]MBF9252681.1 sulfatase [Pontibacter sp. 172403-2]
MRKYFLLLATILSSLVAQAQQKPNIIFFLVDDMGWQDTSVPFWDKMTPANHKFHTPNMEKLAASSMKFTQAYANSICTPTRVSLMTGMNAAHHRVTNWTMYKNTPVDVASDSVLTIPDWNVNGLSPVKGVERSVYATPLPQLLKNDGYFTIHCGKAHFGAHETPGADPLNLGFDVNIAGSAAGNPASYLAKEDYGNVAGKFNLRAVPGLEKYWGTDTFLTEALTTEAKSAMDAALQKNKPFFLYMAHFAVHLPFDADKRYIEKYLAMGLEEQEAAYATLVEGMDASLGELMDYLKEKNIAENTIIIFLSDNGGYTLPPRQGEAFTQNYPLRSGKGSLLEGGIRVPMMVRWPGVTRQGSVCSQYVTVEDFLPTIMEMAGDKAYKTVQQVDGQSLVKYLRDSSKKDNERSLVWNFPNSWAAAETPYVSWTSAIRQGDWKLIYLEKPGRLELYNLKNDIGEQVNLTQKYPKKTNQLARELTQKLKKWDAQLPFYKSSGQPVPYPAEILSKQAK